jgi:hypothetical protein
MDIRLVLAAPVNFALWLAYRAACAVLDPFNRWMDARDQRTGF